MKQNTDTDTNELCLISSRTYILAD